MLQRRDQKRALAVGQIVGSFPSLHLGDLHRNHARRHHEYSQCARHDRVEQARTYECIDDAIRHIAQQQQAEPEQGLNVQDVAVPDHDRVS